MYLNSSQNATEGASEIVVVMMLYNHADCVAESLESLLAQTYQGFSILIVDDGSTDRSFEIAKAYQDDFKNFHIMKNEKNKGAVDNFYYILEMMENIMPPAEYFLWACPDDTWSPTYFEECRNKLIENPKASVCQTGYEMIYVYNGTRTNHFLKSVTGNSYNQVKKLLVANYVEGTESHYNCIIHSLMRYKDVRSIFPASRKDLSAACCIELSIVVSAFLCGEIEIIDKIYYHRKKYGAFIDKYPDDPFSKGRNSVWYRMYASLRASKCLVGLGYKKKRSFFVVFPLCFRLIYNYAIRFFLSCVKNAFFSRIKR